MFHPEDCVFQVVMAGVIPTTDHGVLSFHKPLPMGLIGVDAAGNEHTCRIVADIMTGTPEQIVKEEGAKINRAVSTFLDSINADPVKSAAYVKYQTELRAQYAKGAWSTLFGHSRVDTLLEKKVMYGLPDASRNDDNTQAPNLIATPARARALACKLLRWADAQDGQTLLYEDKEIIAAIDEYGVGKRLQALANEGAVKPKPAA